MRIAAHRGSRLHAPENSRQALISGYTAGADVLEFDLQLTKDGYLVVSHDPTTKRLSGEDRRILESTLADLRALDFSETFQPRGAKDFKYYHSVRRMPILRFPEILEDLPEAVELLIELEHEFALDTGRRHEFLDVVVRALQERDLIGRTVVYSNDPDNLRHARQLAGSDLRIATFDIERSANEQLELVQHLDADGLVTKLEDVFSGGRLTDFGRRLEALCTSRSLRVGACLYPHRTPGVFTQEEYEALRGHAFVWSLSTDSMLDVIFVRRGVSIVKNEAFTGTHVDRERFHFGYAKANTYGTVYQNDGVHIHIKPYDQELDRPPTDAVDARLLALEQKLTYTARDWPYYSGGGVGVLQGIRGDFVAEVDYTVQQVGQATTLEMAVLNVDPGAHQATPPATFHGKDSFFDPHGAPPYVGVEHDEDDGYRINWNLGVEYDNNQYGPPVGNGAALGGRLRLERRGAYFAAYYRNDVDAPDWVCVGVTRNESMNRTVFLRCVGKRWRQEDENDPTKYMPILPNRFTFRNLDVTRYL